MGLFDFITNIFHKPSKGKTKVVKKTARVKTGQKKTPEKRKPSNTKREKTRTKSIKNKKSAPNLLLKVANKDETRKKAKQFKADPINEEALGFNISLKGEDEQSKKRNALRIKVKGLTVYIDRLKKQFPVSDISATGLGFEFEKPRIKGGVKLKMNIYLKDKIMVSDVMCKVMRHERGSVGCIFIDLDRAQDDAVHGIVLLGQKQQAARKAARKDQNFKIPT